MTTQAILKAIRGNCPSLMVKLEKIAREKSLTVPSALVLCLKGEYTQNTTKKKRVSRRAFLSGMGEYTQTEGGAK